MGCTLHNNAGCSGGNTNPNITTSYNPGSFQFTLSVNKNWFLSSRTYCLACTRWGGIVDRNTFSMLIDSICKPSNVNINMPAHLHDVNDKIWGPERFMPTFSSYVQLRPTDPIYVPAFNFSQATTTNAACPVTFIYTSDNTATITDVLDKTRNFQLSDPIWYFNVKNTDKDTPQTLQFYINIKSPEGIGIVGSWSGLNKLNLVGVTNIVWANTFSSEQWFYYPINTTAIFGFPKPVISSTPSIPYNDWVSVWHYNATTPEEYSTSSTLFVKKFFNGSDFHEWELLPALFNSKRTNKIYGEQIWSFQMSL